MESDDEDEAISSLLGNGKPPRDRRVDKDLLLPKNSYSLRLSSHRRFNLVYWIMYVQGIGTLLPWNMFITAHTVNTLFMHS